jgi:Na+/proline symporter
VVLAHIPLGLLPHLGNKLWALKGTDQQKSFIKLAFTFGITLGMLGLAGLLARGVLGDALLQVGETANASLPMLFIELFPTWLAALIGVGILAAIMSTADGLVVSSSQIIANDLYRRSLAKYLTPNATPEQQDRIELHIGRVATVATLVICTVMAWSLIDMNIAIIVWIGIGGMMAAFAGPLVLGALWKGVTKHGAYCGLIGGFGLEIIGFPEDASAATLTPDVLNGLLFMTGPLYRIIVFSGMLFMALYNLNRARHDEIMAALEVRRAARGDRQRATPGLERA